MTRPRIDYEKHHKNNLFRSLPLYLSEDCYLAADIKFGLGQGLLRRAHIVRTLTHVCLFNYY